VNRRHALVIALFLALALVAGLFAAVRTTQLGAAASPAVPAAQIAAKNRQLDRAEAKLKRAAKQRPPALPALPASQPPAQLAAGAAPPRTVYVRPAPIVRVVPRHGESEHEGDHEHGHESEHEHDGGHDD
jgi:hypothetical protein